MRVLMSSFESWDRISNPCIPEGCTHLATATSLTLDYSWVWRRQNIQFWFNFLRRPLPFEDFFGLGFHHDTCCWSCELDTLRKSIGGKLLICWCLPITPFQSSKTHQRAQMAIVSGGDVPSCSPDNLINPRMINVYNTIMRVRSMILTVDWSWL